MNERIGELGPVRLYQRSLAKGLDTSNLKTLLRVVHNQSYICGTSI